MTSTEAEVEAAVKASNAAFINGARGTAELTRAALSAAEPLIRERLAQEVEAQGRDNWHVTDILDLLRGDAS